MLDYQKDEQVAPTAAKPEISLEAKMTKQAVLLRAHHEKAGFFGGGAGLMLGRTEGSRKRGRPNMRWTDFIKEATGMSLQELSRAVEDRALWMSLIQRIARGWS